MCLSAANVRTSGSAKTMPSATCDEGVDDVIAEPPRRLFDVARVLVKVGTNAALIAPSANRSRSRLGMRNATLYASMAAPAPKNEATTCSRTTPRMRLVIVASRPTRPDRSSRKKLAQEPSAADGLASPSAFLPASFGMTAFITLPRSFADVAPVSAMASATAASISSGVADGGR